MHDVQQRRKVARAATVAGLVLGAFGIAAQRLAGMPMPPVQPGLVMLVAAAVLVVFLDRRWTLLVGAVVGAAEAVGFVLAGSLPAMLGGSSLTMQVATWVRATGIVLALVARVLAAAALPRATERAPARDGPVPVGRAVAPERRGVPGRVSAPQRRGIVSRAVAPGHGAIGGRTVAPERRGVVAGRPEVAWAGEGRGRPLPRRPGGAVGQRGAGPLAWSPCRASPPGPFTQARTPIRAPER